MANTAGKLRPHLWVSGPDPERHRRYRIWIQAKNQAQFRKEIWMLTFDEWLEIWEPHWEDRGRGPGKKVLTRVNFNRPWSPTNARVVTRAEFAQAEARRRREKV